MNLEQHWWQTPATRLSKILTPLAWLYHAIDRANARLTMAKVKQVAPPVVVIGNILVGGTGKSLMIDCLARSLQNRGLRVGVVSRGYGANVSHARIVPATGEASEFGDEPIMLKQNNPDLVIAVAKKRLLAAELIAEQVDVILSDDGLQHYKLWRDVEVIMLDGQRLLGNQRLLPAGPLREKPQRLVNTDFIVTKGPAARNFSPDAELRIEALEFIPLSPDASPKNNLAAITGIGNPDSFFASLTAQGLTFSRHVFPDHHQFSAKDLVGLTNKTLICTAKDAVKLTSLVDQPMIVCRPRLSLSNNKITDHIEALCRSI
ncbi:tetraacyldisaccharide 4'-kinase [Salinibius halmophilus]|uniref:tetraacyldisaccharide 4'-kinase n=1 Tax=Salinibius halmophilus TaxID=1853216 RepID=UPI000E6677CB|nr:tetraacyldisaccharide 4'-kinase [Salinibius halmophilus]